MAQVTLLHIGSGEGWIDVTLNIIGAQGSHSPSYRARCACIACRCGDADAALVAKVQSRCPFRSSLAGPRPRPKSKVEQAIPVVIFMVSRHESFA